jgi:hypothetical protein
MKCNEINAKACMCFSLWRMCNEMHWNMNPVLSAHTNLYLVDIGVILILLKGFSYHILRGKCIIAPGTTVFKLLNEMQMTLTQ